MLTTDLIPFESSQASHTTCTHKAESTAEPRSISHVHVAFNVACVAFNGVSTREHAVRGAHSGHARHFPHDARVDGGRTEMN